MNRQSQSISSGSIAKGIDTFSSNSCEKTAIQNSSPIGETISDTVIDPNNGSQLYMADYDSGKIIVWDTKCQQIVKEIPVSHIQ